MIPTDPNILLGYINLKLRDEYPSLEELCDALDEDREEIEEILNKGGYKYNGELNQFR